MLSLILLIPFKMIPIQKRNLSISTNHSLIRILPIVLREQNLKSKFLDLVIKKIKKKNTSLKLPTLKIKKNSCLKVKKTLPAIFLIAFKLTFLPMKNQYKRSVQKNNPLLNYKNYYKFQPRFNPPLIPKKKNKIVPLKRPYP